jgi:hypothetical protein
MLWSSTVEMTHGCGIGDFVTNSMIVHAESETPTGTYKLAPISMAFNVESESAAGSLLPAGGVSGGGAQAGPGGSSPNEIDTVFTGPCTPT